LPACRERSVAESNGAHRWLALLEDGKFGSVSELAEAVGLDPSLVRRHLNLTLLRPDLVRQILAGDEPDGLSLRGIAAEGAGALGGAEGDVGFTALILAANCQPTKDFLAKA